MSGLPGSLRGFAIRAACAPLGAVVVSHAVGSGDDPPGAQGLARVAEIAVRRSRSRGRTLAERVAMLGGELASRTAPFWTEFEAATPVERVDDLLSVLTTFGQARLEPADLEHAQDVVLRELASGAADPRLGVLRDAQSLAFRGAGAGAPVSGDERSVRGITLEQVRGLLRERYVDPVVSVFGGRATPRPPELRPARRPRQATETGSVRVRVAAIAQQHIACAFRAPGLRDPALWAAVLAAELLGAPGTGRLHRRLREERGLCYTARALYAPHDLGGAFLLHCAALPATAAEALRIMRSEVSRLAVDLTPDELRAAAVRVFARSVMSAEGALGRARAELEWWRMTGVGWSVDAVRSAVQAVTVENIAAFAHAYGGDNLVAAHGPLDAVSLGLRRHAIAS